MPADGPLIKATVGVRLRLGTRRRLVEFSRLVEAWRNKATGVEAIDIPGGYRVEARLPLSILTPLLAPKVGKIRYRVTVFDAHSGDARSQAVLRFEGVATLNAPMSVSLRNALSASVDQSLQAKSVATYAPLMKSFPPLVR